MVRVMVLVKATDYSEKGNLATPAMFEAMGRFNEQLVNVGIMLFADSQKIKRLEALKILDLRSAQ